MVKMMPQRENIIKILQRLGFKSSKNKSSKKKFRRVIAELDFQERFTRIFQINYWGSEESASGKGSTLDHTKNLRAELPVLLERFDVRKIFDGPCGDFHWMKYVLTGLNVDYVGADIVKPMIENNSQKYSTSKIQFQHMDLRFDEYPSADLMICRDCLFHLSYEDTAALLKNFIKSNIPYLLTTTYPSNGVFRNVDIVSGHFRLIDLFTAPYNFPEDVLYKIDDWVEPNEERWMCLWSREQLIVPISKL